MPEGDGRIIDRRTDLDLFETLYAKAGWSRELLLEDACHSRFVLTRKLGLTELSMQVREVHQHADQFGMIGPERALIDREGTLV